MAFRIEEVRYQKIDRDDRHAWHWRFKGVYGRGIYGSIVTNDQGRGLYLLAEGDLPGLPGDWESRLSCLVLPDGFGLASDATIDRATEALATALLHLGWGPRVFA